MNDDFKDLLSLLAASGARFLVVGAHAYRQHPLTSAPWKSPPAPGIPWQGRFNERDDIVRA